MSGCSPTTSSVSKVIGSGLPVCSRNWEKVSAEYKQSVDCRMKELVHVTPLDLSIQPVDEKKSVMVPLFALDGKENVNNKDQCGQISVPYGNSRQNDRLLSDEVNMCQEFDRSLSLDKKVMKGLSKCRTFPVSSEREAYSSSMTDRADLRSNASQGQDSSASGTSAYSRSISLPSSSTLVSAMKGGRALKGTTMKSELRVKWAPEVYDPPTTTISHTVNRHQPRPKSKKKDKHKQKNKSSRGNVGEKKQKHGNRKSANRSPDPSNVGLQSHGGRLVLEGFDKSKVADIFEHGINGQDGKCGSSFLRGALPKLHLPMAEAS